MSESARSSRTFCSDISQIKEAGNTPEWSGLASVLHFLFLNWTNVPLPRVLSLLSRSPRVLCLPQPFPLFVYDDPGQKQPYVSLEYFTT